MWDSFRNLFYAGKGHERLLTIWGAAHYGSALLAFCIFCSLIRCGVVLAFGWESHSECNSLDRLITEFVCLALYGITFYRFSRGDLKYLNWVYLILQGNQAKSLLDEKEEKQLQRDLVALIIRAMAFTALANNITDPMFFFFPFAFLLLADIPWLFVRYRQCKALARNQETSLPASNHSHCAETLLRWLVNNVISLFALVTLIVVHLFGGLDAEEFLWLSVLTCITNSLVDIVMTRWVYRSGVRVAE